MDKVKFNYEMLLEFENPVHDHYFTLRCVPRQSQRQQIEDMSIEVSPYDTLCDSFDGFGNTTYIGHKKKEHSSFSVKVNGLANVDWSKYDTDTNLNMCYRIQSPLTMASREMYRFFEENIKPLIETKSPYDLVEYIMHEVHKKLQYEKNSTDVNTIAAMAYDQGKGVCQDYAHIMISFVRMATLPARYVVGLMMGEGESHAWVEVFCKDRWYGFDPTNDSLIGNEYIILSKGRDYKDCIINQGKFYGLGKQTQTIKAKVEKIDG